MEHHLSKELVLKSGRLSIIAIVLVTLYPLAAFAQETSVPQITLSSRGLADVSFSTIPPNPVTGQQTVILIKFFSPQTNTPRVDFFYNFIIRNETSPVLTVPMASTITGVAGIPYEFKKSGSYQVEVDLNDTSLQETTPSLPDQVIFPLYVSEQDQVTNQTAINDISQNSPTVNLDTTKDNHFVFDGVLLAIVVGIALFMIRRRFSRRKKLDA
jgi:hypothetical protein